jgi:hypothetical protein
MAKNKKVIKIILWICGGVTALTLISAYPGYLLAKAAFNRYFLKWGEKLVDLEKRGLLSREYGAGWQDVLTNEAMDQQAARIVDKDEERENSEVRVVDGVTLDDYPSLSIIDRLREVRQYSNTIEIVDRFDRLLATIKPITKGPDSQSSHRLLSPHCLQPRIRTFFPIQWALSSKVLCVLF